MKHSLLSLKLLAPALNSLDTLSDTRIFRIFDNKLDLHPETSFYNCMHLINLRGLNISWMPKARVCDTDID